MDKKKQPAKRESVGSGAGISGSKRAVEALRESERLYRSLTECSSDAIFCVNEKGQYKFANQLFASTFGKCPDYFIGKTFWDIYPKEHADYRFVATRRVFETGQSESVEVEVPLPDKTLFFYATANPIKDETGKVILVLTHAVDITERKKTEEALRESESLYRLLSEHTTDTVWLMDMNLKITYHSPSVQKMRGFTAQEITEMPTEQHVTPESFKLVSEVLLNEIPRVEAEPDYNPVLTLELEYYCKDGTTIWTENKFSVIRDENCRPVSILGEARDITERRKAEQALQESEAGIRKKLNAILEPAGDISSLELSDILDYQSIQLLMDDFYSLTGIGVAIVDTQGKILVATGWQDICTRFHRVHPETQKHCLESDITLTSDVAPGQVKLYKCKNNMWDVATPIYLGENHIGNIFYGQFFFADEAPDHNFFRRQAGQYGFDEEAYMAALNRAIRWDRDKIDLIMAFYARFATMISTLSYSAIKLARTLAENDRTLSALKDSEEKFRAIAEQSSDVVYLTDAKGAIVFISGSAEAVFGLKAREMTGRNFVEFLAPSDIDKAFAHFTGAIEKGQAIDTLELQMKRGDGTLFFGELRGSVINLAGFRGTAGIIRDITERRKAEQALQESEERFRNMANLLPQTLFETDEKGNFTFVNRQGFEMFGYSEADVAAGISVFETIISQDRDRAMESISLRIKGKEPPPQEYTALRKNGSTFPAMIYAAPIIIDSRYAGMRGMLIDITDSKRAEEALRGSEEKYRSVVENSMEAIVIAENGVIKFGNRQASALTGYSQEEYLSRPLIAFIHPDDRHMVAKRYFQQINNMEVTDIFAFRLIGKSGDIKWVEVSLAPIIWEGRPASLNFMHDVTDRKRLEEERQRVARLESVGLLAGGIAHDFNNILTSILGNISLAGMEAAPGSELQNSLDQAEKASLRAKDLTRQLLTFSKGGVPVLKLASLTELIRDTAGFALRGSNVKCRFSIPADLWHAEIDAGQISQVIHNLVINAQQAMPTGGTIEIIAENMTPGGTQSIDKGLPLKAGAYIRISVVDHGTGIPSDHLEKIFDPFFSTKQKGSGLGLATSFSIAHQHGGHISVESAPGAGSTFYLYLPASLETVNREPEQDRIGSIKPAGSARILVMDDEQGVRDIAGRLLQHIGYQDVVFASDGAEAIKLYKASMKSGRPFTAAILDLTIAGGMGGKEAIKKLLKVDPGVKAIVSSGYADDPVIAKYRDFGFSGMVAKPYTIEELRKALQDVME